MGRRHRALGLMQCLRFIVFKVHGLVEDMGIVFAAMLQARCLAVRAG
jgi:hypothetical protein